MLTKKQLFDTRTPPPQPTASVYISQQQP